MKFTAASALSCAALAAASAVTQEKRADCPEASRFGVLQVVPSNLTVGSGFTIHTDFSCARTFGIVPKYTDYYISVPEGNNGHEPPVLLYRRDYNPAGGDWDTFTADVPAAFYFNASYAVEVQVTYPQNGTDGQQYFTMGSTYLPIDLTVPQDPN
ncbi:hypothetical protein CONPUDRAFT_163542 [Coniophora puteana RWD-64-598 SS2]|uniref:Uncharacterized protein n=1 Tax=Coniophora puteana (strain RWD-64-598) TaxID=741705 RepID=A0A5M3MZ31_CONPW|nr:uncharacterized protein CONPUDRAFT_163542 [Coniophora puteana RWD-64-598 SS2]EIW84400.1 hypothetical protein CONPUDRAFT_163542 [Coniophora puteana RWD-64-598 SS2]